MAKKPAAECPHCGEGFATLKNGSEIPTHDFPRPCRQVCPGSGEAPRRKDSQLWKDEPKQRERDFLDGARMELRLYGFAVVKQVAMLRGDNFGDIECPLCGGSVRYSIATSNGHCSAVCDRPGCVKAME